MAASSQSRMTSGSSFLEHGGDFDHLPVLVDQQQEKTAGEDDEHPAAEPVLLRARHVARDRGDVGDR